jgi:hypothetical protein
MPGICWRLLACLSLIFLAATLRGEKAGPERSRVIGPALAVSSTTPLMKPESLPVAGNGPWLDPVVRGTIAFPQIVHSAGIIFSGRVTFVGRADGHAPISPGSSSAATAVTFLVEHAIRGTTSGQSLTIHEWAGLWTGKEKQRYRVGERVFLFLYSPSKLGLTSPVAGAGGKFAIDAQGRIAMSAQNASALAADPVVRGRRIIPYNDFMRAVRGAGVGE